MRPVLIAVLTACSAAGLLLAVAGLAGRPIVDRVEASRPTTPRPMGRICGALAVGGVALLITGWPLAAGLLAVATWRLPRLLGGRSERRVGSPGTELEFAL